MNAFTRFAKRALAVIGVASIGVLGVASGASAEPIPGNINPETVGSIIIHKHVEDEASTPGEPAGAPLEGVTFKVTEVLYLNDSVALDTAEGWQAIDGLTVEGAQTGDFSRGTSQDVTTDALGAATAGNLGIGLYLVEEIASGPNLITTPAAPFLVTIPYPTDSGWDYNVDVYPKNLLGTVNPTKTVGTPDSPADVELGAIVPFTISVPVANPPLPYVSFSITDALSAGLAFDSWGEIAIGGVALTATDYEISADNTTVTLLASGLTKLNTAATAAAEGTTVTAVINAEVTDLGQLENEADAIVNGTSGTTPPVTTNWASLDITKISSKDESVNLAGAEFELWNEDKSVHLATGTTDSNGELSFDVWVGNNADVTEVVWLKETVAPQGYVLPADPWFGSYTLTAGTTAELSILDTTISNYPPEGPDLPLTGAQGTMLFTVGGLLLVGAGGIALAVSRRQKTQ